MTVDAHAEALYGGDPASFVARRDELARRLRSSGDRDAAAAVKALRRPTSAAAVLNRIAREEPDLVAACLAGAEHLARTQRRALSGLSDADVRGAVRAHHAAIAAVLAAGGPQTVAVADAMRTTLLAAAVDALVADALQRGVLAATATQDDPSAALLGSAPLTAVDPRLRAVPDSGASDQDEDRDKGTDKDTDQEEAAAGEAARAAARARAEAAIRQAAATQVAAAERALGTARADQVATARRQRAATTAAATATKGAAAAQGVVERLRAELAQAEELAAREAAEVARAQQSLEEATRRDEAARAGIAEAQGVLEEAQHHLAALDGAEG